jgi:hypothetical protein
MEGKVQVVIIHRIDRSIDSVRFRVGIIVVEFIAPQGDLEDEALMGFLTMAAVVGLNR